MDVNLLFSRKHLAPLKHSSQHLSPKCQHELFCALTHETNAKTQETSGTGFTPLPAYLSHKDIPHTDVRTESVSPGSPLPNHGFLPTEEIRYTRLRPRESPEPKHHTFPCPFKARPSVYLTNFTDKLIPGLNNQRTAWGPSLQRAKQVLKPAVPLKGHLLRQVNSLLTAYIMYHNHEFPFVNDQPYFPLKGQNTQRAKQSHQ